MNFQKSIARKIVFPAVMKLGFDKVLRSRSAPSILNVMYHGVVESDSTFFSPRHIHVAQFEKQLKYLKRNFTILTIDDAFYKLVNNEKLDRKYVTVSFDDGFKNNLNTALPLLEKYEIPTTFFVSGVCAKESGNRILWSELISALNYFYKDQNVVVDRLIFLNSYN